MVFIDASGRAVYKSRHDILQQAVARTFEADALGGATPGTSADNIANRFTVTKTDGVAQTVTNAASAHDYTQRDGTSVESPLLHDDAHAGALAAELGRLYGDPDDPVRDLTLINGDRARLLQILQRELGERVVVQETGGGTDGDYIIQQATHTVAQAQLIR